MSLEDIETPHSIIVKVHCPLLSTGIVQCVWREPVGSLGPPEARLCLMETRVLIEFERHSLELRKGSKNAMILAAQTEKRDHELLKAMVPFQSRTDRPALTVITHAESHVTSMEAAEE